MTNETIIREVAELKLARDLATAVRETFTYKVEVRSVDNGRVQVWVTEPVNRDRRMELVMFGIGYEQAWKLHQQVIGNLDLTCDCGQKFTNIYRYNEHQRFEHHKPIIDSK